MLVNNAGLTRDGLLARMSDDDWRDGDRDEPQLGLLHLPRGDAADDEEALRARSSTSARSSACTATGARRTTPRRRPGSSASRSRSRASSARANVRANVVAPGLREDAADRGAARGGDEGDDRQHAARPRRRAGRGRRGGTLPLPPTRRRSSRARCCSSTADWGCEHEQRTDSRRVVITGLGMVSPLGNDVQIVVVARCSPASPARPRSPRSTTPTTTSTSPAS